MAQIYRFRDDDEVVAAANATQYGLAAYFYYRDVKAWPRSRSFGVWHSRHQYRNDIHRSGSPFGGVKESALAGRVQVQDGGVYGGEVPVFWGI